MAQPRMKSSDIQKDTFKESNTNTKIKKIPLDGHPGFHKNTTPSECGDRLMNNYFQYKEIGRVKSILKNKYNLFNN